MEKETAVCLFGALFTILVLLSFFTKSGVAKWLTLIISVVGFIAIIDFTILEYDCTQDKFVYVQCSFLPDKLAAILSSIYFFCWLFIVFVSPVLVLVALGFEIYVRKIKFKRSQN